MRRLRGCCSRTFYGCGNGTVLWFNQAGLKRRKTMQGVLEKGSEATAACVLEGFDGAVADSPASATAPFDPLKLESQLCFPLYVGSKEVVRRYKPFLDGLGITYTQYIVLMALWEEQGVSVGELGAKLYLDSGTLTPLLKKMEANGLIARERSDSDERKVVVTLTQKGHDMKKRAADIPFNMARCVDLSAEEANLLKHLLSKVIANIRAS